MTESRVSGLSGAAVESSAGAAVGSPGAVRAVYAKAPNLHWTQLEGETVILNLETGAYFTLNEVGSAAWDTFNGQRTLQEVLDGICRRFSVDPDTALKDLLVLIGELRQEQLIVESDGRN